MRKKSNKVYVYDLNKAEFFISQGVKPLFRGIHNRTKKIYYCFDYYEQLDAFEKWALKLNK